MSRAKRTRYYESEDSEEDEPDKALAEEFDPESYYHANQKLKLSESVHKYVDSHFHFCLSREVRRAMARDNPLPNTPSLHPPETDDVLVDYMGNDFPSSSEEHYKRIQTAVISASAPMLNLWTLGGPATHSWAGQPNPDGSSIANDSKIISPTGKCLQLRLRDQTRLDHWQT